MEILKKIFQYGLITYTSLYLALSGHVIYDFNANHRKWLEENVKNELVIKNFSANLEGKVKELTFAGETHVYNEKESSFSKDFVKQFDLALIEGGDSNNFNLSNGVFLGLSFIPVTVSVLYISLGNGRYFTNPTLKEFVKDSGVPMYNLEGKTDGGLETLSFSQKAQILGLFSVAAILGPLMYYKAKKFSSLISFEEDEKKEKEAKDYVDRIANKILRNTQMAKEIVNQLKSKEAKKILIVVGKRHIDGLIKNLSQKIIFEGRP